MSFTFHDLANLPKVIDCLSVATQTDRHPLDDDEEAQSLILNGRLKINRGVTYNWIDLSRSMHFVRVEHDEKPPKFRVITVPNLRITHEFGEVTLRKV